MTLAEPDPHEFDFDLDRGIREQVREKLEGTPLLPFEKDAAPKRSGVYALYLDGNLVYVGMASSDRTRSKRTLRSRLNEHVSKISRRENISPGQVKFRYLTFRSDWWVFAAEYALIELYQPEWNHSGFGSKTPGKGRPGTDRVSRWDSKYPKRKS